MASPVTQPCYRAGQPPATAGQKLPPEHWIGRPARSALSLAISALIVMALLPAAFFVPLFAPTVAVASSTSGSISAGNYHSLAVKPDGSVWAWGQGGTGALGDGTNTDRHSPVQVRAGACSSCGTYLTGITAVSAGSSHSLALKSDGTVWAWGYNDAGQLGNNTTTNSSTPIQVRAGACSSCGSYLTGITAITGGTDFSLALRSDGRVYGWGWNANGRLGDNTTIERNTPVQVLGAGGTGTLTGITAINTSGSANHSLALKSDGTVWAWGYNSNGQLGDNTTTDRYAPVQVLGVGGTGHLSGITAIAVGSLHSLALKSDGTVWAWGSNAFGSLGDGTETQRLTPVQVVGVGGTGSLTGVFAISAGQWHSLALKSDGTVYAWGFNAFGQLGDNDAEPSSSTPIHVLAGACSGCGTYLTGVTALAAGIDFSLALRSDGTLYAWAVNDHGQLGDNTTTERDTPVQSGIAGVLLPQQPPAGSALTTATAPGSPSPAAPYVELSYHAAAEPIDTATGSFFASHSDLSIPGRSYPLAFNRSYNSVLAATNSPLGYGWQPSYGMKLTVVGSVVTITQETGATVDFTLSGGVYTAAPRVIATLTLSGGVYTFKRNGRDTFTFNSGGQLTSEKDPNGYMTALTYTGGNLTSVADPAARILTIAWTGSHITSVTDANVTPNRVVSYQYNDGKGNLTDVIDPKGGRWHFTYDTGHQLLTMQDPKCYAVSCPGIQNTYTNGQVTAQKDQLNRQTTFAYSVPLANALTASSATTTVTDPKGNVTLDGYQFGLLTSMTRGYETAQAATTQYRYDPKTLAPTLVRDTNGNATTYTVDGNGNVLTATDPLGRKTINTYNAFNEVLTSEDPNQVASLPNGATTTNVYDTKGNLTSTSRPLTSPAATQTVTYNHTDGTHPGDVTSMVDPDRKTWIYGYDTNGYRNAVTDPLGNKTTTVFNNDGMMTSSVTPKGNVTGCGCASTYRTTYINDVFGKTTTVTPPSPAGPMISTYDADENLSTVKDPNNNTTTYVYDVANEQTQVKRADTPQTMLVTDYNPDGTVLDQKDGKGNTILTYGYDSLARVTTVTDALSNVTTLTYDLAGNRLTQQDPGGNCATPTRCTRSTYDADNELKTITYSDGVTPNVTNTTYDSDGQRTGITDGTGSSTWVWDSLHRLTSYTNGKSSQVQYAYNLRNLPTKITYPGTTGAVTQGYDDAGRLTSVQDWLTHTTTFGYDANSNMTPETLPATTGVVDTNTFDKANNLATISDKKGATTIFAATYGRDSANQLTSDTSVPAAVGKYKYTTLNQLCYAGSANSTACASPPASSYPYAFDSADNLTKTENATHTGSVTQQFNAADELCWTVAGASANTCASAPPGSTTYAYDARGNRTGALTGTAGKCDAFDQANRLTSIKKGTGATCTTPTTVGTYAYNGDGLRMSKTIGANTTQNTWGMGLLLQEKVGSATATSYVYGPGGLPLEQITPTGTVYYYHHDQLGSTRAITDSAGAAKATYTYDPYGNVTACTGTTVTIGGSNKCTGTVVVTNPLTYSGQYRDDESGLIYLRARYYDPANAQFMSRDPMVAMTRSPYAYVSGNPLNRTDPSGLDDGCAWWDTPCHAAALLAAAEAKAAELASHVRQPDYISLNVGAGPLPGGIDKWIPGTTGGVNITLSRSGHIFFTPQTGLSTPGFSASLRGGWINQSQKPSCGEVDKYIKGPSVGVDSYQPIGDGIFGPSEGVTWGNPGGFNSSDTSTEVGIGAGWGRNISAQGGDSQQLPFNGPSWGN